MGGDFYQKAFARHGLEAIAPDEEAQQKINRIIYDELVLAEVKEDSKAYALALIDDLARDKGAEGVVLGCTELPFLIQQADTQVPVFDTTVIHAQKALDLALEGRA